MVYILYIHLHIRNCLHLHVYILYLLKWLDLHKLLVLPWLKLLFLHILWALKAIVYHRHFLWLLILFHVCTLVVEISPAAELVWRCIFFTTVFILVAFIVGFELVYLSTNGELFILLIFLRLLNLWHKVVLLWETDLHHLPSVIHVKNWFLSWPIIWVGEWSESSLKSVNFLL